MAKKYNLENNPLFSQSIQPADPDPKEAEPEAGPRKRGRPMKADIVHGVSTQEGLTAEYTRATFIIRVDLLNRLKDYVYTERISMKDAMNKILEDALNEEEQRINSEGGQILSRDGGKE